MGNNLVWVVGDDWEGVYVNRDLISEGHRIHRNDLIDILNKYTIHSAETKNFNNAGLDWLHEEGSLPEYFFDIASEYFEEE